MTTSRTVLAVSNRSGARRVSGPAIGWLNRKVFEETGDEQRAQGWAPFVLDTSGNGKGDDYVGPGEAVDPKKDKRMVAGIYGAAIDGRIDDPAAGWKGKGLRAATSTRAPFHMEGGKGTRPKVAKFQLRPGPLAR